MVPLAVRAFSARRNTGSGRLLAPHRSDDWGREAVVTRNVFRSTVFVVAALGVAGRHAAADAIVVTFDDLRGDNLDVPAGYGGIDWLNGWTHYGFSQPP